MRYLMTFSYDGSKYQGYQKQPEVKTVQSEIERAIRKIAGNKIIIIHASGRTDAGVHAYNQKAHFDLETKMTPERLRHSINSLIPDDIYIKKIEQVSEAFHSRFDVTLKTYIYKINMGEYNPIEKDYIYQCNETLNIAEMKRALTYLEGTHDFKSFSKADEKENYVRTIKIANLIRDTKNIDYITILFTGTGFLRYQVRNMVGTLIEIGEGKKKSEDIIDILKARDRRKAGITAPASGLYLKDVYYK